MTTAQLYQELNYVNHSREKRLFYANLLLENPDLRKKTLEILFNVDDKISPRAAWIFEFMCKEHLEEIVPYLDYFIENIHKVHIDSAVRPVAKICEFLAYAYYAKEDNKIKHNLQDKHIVKIIETCFDWMISEEKVAVKAYSMSTLFLFGKDYDWVHPELLQILEQDFYTQSAAFKARAKHIFKKLKKK